MITHKDYPGITFLNIDDVDKFINDKSVLYKYLPLENALRNLESRGIWLSNPTKWEDPFEYRFLNAKYFDKSGIESEFPYREKIFATCLTRDPYSEAQWNAYSKDSLAIRFMLDTKNLLEQLSKYAVKNSLSIFFGNVEYRKREDIEVGCLLDLKFDVEAKGTIINKSIDDIDFCAHLLLLKRQDFSYEKEIRIIAIKKRPIKADGINCTYECDNKTLIKNLVVSPKVKDSTFEMLKKYIAEKYDMPPKTDKKGRKQPLIQRSHLYDEDKNVKISI